MTTADAVDRETAWLTNSGDGLPALLAADGGPWDLIQAYQPRTPPTQERSIFVLRLEFDDDRFDNVRKMVSYSFALRVNWPILASTGSAEDEQRALDAAIWQLLQRVRGPEFDKTHGGRFTSVGENPGKIRWRQDDPLKTIPAKVLTGEFSYFADDEEENV